MTQFNIQKGRDYAVKLEEMPDFAEAVLVYIKTEHEDKLQKESVLVTLSGNLGAGKTTFSQELSKKLGIVDHVTSPTFVIQKTYTTADSLVTQLVHMDMYRIEDENEVVSLGLHKTLKVPGGLVVMEWPEKVPGVRRGADLNLIFEVVDQNYRKVSVVQ